MKEYYEERPEDYELDPQLVEHARQLLIGVGFMEEGEANPHTIRTPYRLIHYLKYLLPERDEFPLTRFPNESPKIDHMVVVPHIPFWSGCSHH
jgi:GTP cyclohydrolase I